jgi:hypothetical protein
MSELLPGEPERDREAELPGEPDEDAATSGEPGTRHSDQPQAPTTPGAGEGPVDSSSS